MPWRVPILLTLTLLFAAAGAQAQTGQTATLEGTVADVQGNALAGVTITLTGPTPAERTRTAVTRRDGTYRVPANPPGLYEVTFELPGYTVLRRAQVRLRLGQSVTLRVRLEIGTTTAPEADALVPLCAEVTSSAPQRHVTPEALESVPFASRAGADAMVLAPGVHPVTSMLYSRNGPWSDARILDGADVTDPYSGAAAVRGGFHWIQEVQIVGPGADAEHGGYSGAASITLLRSGGNRVHGLSETRYQGGSMVSANTTAALLEQNPDLAAGTVNHAADLSLQLGGPIKRDRAWFFTGFQYSHSKVTPAGYPPSDPVTGQAWVSEVGGTPARVDRFPRVLVKPTWQVARNQTLTGFFEWERQRADGVGAGARVSPEAALRQAAPVVAWHASHSTVLASTTTLDVAYSGFRGHDDTDPYGPLDAAGWYDDDTGFLSRNASAWRHAERSRDQARADLSTSVPRFGGAHVLRAGVAYDRSRARTTLGYPGGGEIHAYSGVADYQYLQETSVLEGVNHTLTAFAQDSWRPARTLTFNLGVRADRRTGRSPGLGRTVLQATTIAPRLGVAWDLRGNGRTVLRAHVGDFHEDVRTSFYQRVDPRQPPRYVVDLDPRTLAPVSQPALAAVYANRTVDPSLKWPVTRQASVSVERLFSPRTSLSATYVYRQSEHDIDDVVDPTHATFTTYEYADPGRDGIPDTGDENGNVITVYSQTSSVLDNSYIITNPANAFRRYQGVELQWTRRMSDRWMVQGAWIISKTTGNIADNRSEPTSAEYNDPNADAASQPLREGRLSGDNTHAVRALVWWRAPLGFSVTGDVWYISGDAFTRTVRPKANQGRPEMFIEPRGSRKYAAQSAVNLRVDRAITLRGQQRVTLALEVFSLLNLSTVTRVTVQTPVSPASAPFGTPQALVEPRRMFVSATYRF